MRAAGAGVGRLLADGGALQRAADRADDGGGRGGGVLVADRLARVGVAVIRVRLVTVASPGQAAMVGLLLGAWLLALGMVIEAVAR